MSHESVPVTARDREGEPTAMGPTTLPQQNVVMEMATFRPAAPTQPAKGGKAGEGQTLQEREMAAMQGALPAVIFLRPVAAPSALGLASYASSTLIVAAWLARWYGDASSPFSFWPFMLFFGGVGQFFAGMWSFVARDTLASVVHTMWGSFWIALGVFFYLQSIHVIPVAPSPYAKITELAIWMACLGFITLMAAVAALVRDWVIAATLFLLGFGSVLASIGWFHGIKGLIYTAAYFFIISVFTALYRVFIYFLVEGFPLRFTPGVNDLLPRYSPAGVRQMFTAGYKYGVHEPGIIKGN